MISWIFLYLVSVSPAGVHPGRPVHVALLGHSRAVLGAGRGLSQHSAQCTAGSAQRAMGSGAVEREVLNKVDS